MFGFSTQEYEELGVAIGEGIRKDMTTLFGQAGVPETLNENAIQKAVDVRVRELLKKSAGRSAPWLNPISPMDIAVIEKALYWPDDMQKKDDAIIQLQILNDDMYVLSKALDKPIHTLDHYEYFKARWGALAKALNTATAGDGLEWMAEGFSSQMIDFVELEAVVAPLFDEINMPTDPYTFPITLADGEAYKGGEATDNEPDMFRASDMTSDNLTFRSVKIVANYPISDEASEDAMFPIMPIMKKSIARAVSKARDNAIINGQLTADLDTGYTLNSYDARKLWDGLRYLTQTDLKQSGAGWASNTGLGLLRGIREDMEVFGMSSSDLEILCNTNMWNKLKNIDEVTTVDKTGSVATLLNGEIQKVDGMHITPSQHVFENINASGVYDGITLSKTQALVVNKTGFWRGNRRQFKLETERVARKGITYLVASTREKWQAKYDATTNPMVGWLYNIPK